jgi:hypothetical protein
MAVILSKPGVLQGIVDTGLEDIKKGLKDNVINGTAYTRSKYATEVVLTVGSLFIGAGEVKAASGLGKAGTASKSLKFGKIANGLDKVEDTIAYYNKSDDILRESIIIGKSNKVSKGAEVIKAPFEMPVGGVAGDDMGAMLKGVTQAELPGRNGALNQAKRDAGILRNSKPDYVEHVAMRDPEYAGGHVIKDANGNVIYTRE